MTGRGGPDVVTGVGEAACRVGRGTALVRRPAGRAVVAGGTGLIAVPVTAVRRAGTVQVDGIDGAKATMELLDDGVNACQITQLFAGWRGELATCRKFGPVARNYAAARLMSEGGCGSTRRVSWIWPISSGIWAGSANSMSAMAKALGVQVPASAWCR